MSKAEVCDRNEQGVTLIELLVAVAVLAILAMIAIPSYTYVRNLNRLTAAATEIAVGLQVARSEASRTNRTASFCTSVDGSTCSDNRNPVSMLVLADTDFDGTPEVVRNTPVAPGLEVSRVGFGTRIDFRADGRAYDATGGLLVGRFDVCLPTTQPADNIRSVTLASGSRIGTEPSSGDGECPEVTP